MRVSRQEFLDNPDRAVTLIGMSGAGKTYLSCRLEEQGWRNYSCDYEIGARFLKDDLEAFANSQNFSAENIGVLHEFLGKLGDPAQGGYELDLFRERQMAYYNAEVKALWEMGNVMDQGRGPFIHDSTGSLCEIEDEAVIHDIGQRTLFIYLQTDKDAEQVVLRAGAGLSEASVLSQGVFACED